MFNKAVVGTIANRSFDESSLFRTTWTSADNQITLPLLSGEVYDFDYRIDDSEWINVTSDSVTITGLPSVGFRTLDINHKQGGFPVFAFNDIGDKNKLISVEQIGDNVWNSVIGMFWGCSNLTSIEGVINITNVTNMSFMFRSCSSLISLDVSSWITSNVTNMSFMFNSCSSLTSLDVSSWITSNVTNMIAMFNSCSSLTSLDVSSWITSNVTNMSGMFRSCSSLTSLNVSSWITSNVTNMIAMFNSCSSLTSLDVSSWITSNVTNISGMFRLCSSLTVLDISSWDVSSVTDAISLLESISVTTPIYDAFLINADALIVQNSTIWDFGSSQYTLGSVAETARASLIANDNWIINDGGSV